MLFRSKFPEGIAFSLMPEPIKILTVEIEDDGVIVTLSDGTVTGYVVAELLELRPFRLFKQLGNGSLALRREGFCSLEVLLRTATATSMPAMPVILRQ